MQVGRSRGVGMTEIPASVQNITPECRANRGDAGAIQEALSRIERAYLSYVGSEDNANVTWRISLVRVEVSA
jgi:hypothetical protein